jgi:hypothetical protein
MPLFNLDLEEKTMAVHQPEKKYAQPPQPAILRKISPKLVAESD